jgi:hypothetical protein
VIFWPVSARRGEAGEYFRDALALFRQGGDRPGEGQCYLTMAYDSQREARRLLSSGEEGPFREALRQFCDFASQAAQIFKDTNMNVKRCEAETLNPSYAQHLRA